MNWLMYEKFKLMYKYLTEELNPKAYLNNKKTISPLNRREVSEFLVFQWGPDDVLNGVETTQKW